MGVIYPGSCRNGCDADDAAIRLLTNDSEIAFDDLLQGRIAQHLESESGDFVIRRRDGLIAYHLAVVVDDEMQAVTEIVRGIDLMDSTPRQIWLAATARLPNACLRHIPVVTHADGDKLSKLTGAPGISLHEVEETLCRSTTRITTATTGRIWRNRHAKKYGPGPFENWQLGKICDCKAKSSKRLDNNPIVA